MLLIDSLVPKLVKFWGSSAGPHIVSENLEASLELARVALVRLGGDVPENEALLARFRQDYYAMVDEVGRAKS